MYKNINISDYRNQLLDPRWSAKALEIKNRDNHRCRNCQSPNNLQVHHRQYHFSKMLKCFKSPWDYHDSLLITMCKRAHDIGHTKYKVPINYI